MRHVVSLCSKPKLYLCMLFFKIAFLKKILYGYHQSVKQFGLSGLDLVLNCLLMLSAD